MSDSIFSDSDLRKNLNSPWTEPGDREHNLNALREFCYLDERKTVHEIVIIIIIRASWTDRKLNVQIFSFKLNLIFKNVMQLIAMIHKIFEKAGTIWFQNEQTERSVPISGNFSDRHKKSFFVISYFFGKVRADIRVANFGWRQSKIHFTVTWSLWINGCFNLCFQHCHCTIIYIVPKRMEKMGKWLQYSTTLNTCSDEKFMEPWPTALYEVLMNDQCI